MTTALRFVLYAELSLTWTLTVFGPGLPESDPMPDSPSKNLPETIGPKAAASPPPEGASKPSRVAVASLIGTTIEYYDFAVYGTAAAPFL